jgi:UDP-N-acetyl-D-galactosamine dehydrogenase
VYESTVYPGLTEEVCVRIIEDESGLVNGKDFKVGYSPERINPGDRLHSIDKIVKVVSGQDEEVLEIIAGVYGSIIDAGIHKAPSIKVAEAAKVIENIQRDINIALVNELAIIFERLNIRTSDVLAAAGTKWNFLDFKPGLVGGHCIGVDPYYLTTKAQEVGYYPQVILAGRRINNGMSGYVVDQVVKNMVRMGKQVKDAKVGLFGITFKEDVPDLRNSLSPDIYNRLQDFYTSVLVCDPVCDPAAAVEEYGIALSPIEDMVDLDACIIAVMHSRFAELGPEYFTSVLKKEGGLIGDLKSIFSPTDFPLPIEYWSL